MKQKMRYSRETKDGTFPLVNFPISEHSRWQKIIQHTCWLNKWIMWVWIWSFSMLYTVQIVVTFRIICTSYAGSRLEDSYIWNIGAVGCVIIPISKCVVGNVFCAAIDCTSDITMFCLATGVKAGVLHCCSGVERVDYGALCVFYSQSPE